MSAEYATVELPRRAWARPRVGARLEVLALVALVGAAVLSRLIGIGNDTDLSDEGIRGLQLRMMAAGFRPVTEVYASQGPLSLPAFYPLYLLFGGDIVAARLAVVAYSVVTLLGVVWLGRSIGGPLVGVGAGAVLALSPVYLEHSRVAFVEVPSLAPTVLALVALAAYRAHGARRWLVLSAVLLAVGVLTKPMAAMAAATAGTLLLTSSNGPEPVRGWGRRLGDLLIYGGVGLAVVALIIALVGPAEIWEQVVGYRLNARTARGWDVAVNAAAIRAALGREGLGLLLLAVVGLASLARRRPAYAAALAGWLAAGLAMLLIYSPLWPKHVVYLIPPLAVLAGGGVVAAVRGATAIARHAPPSATGLLALAACAVYLIGVPGLLGQGVKVVERRAGGDLERYDDDLRAIDAATDPGDFVVVDDPYLGLLTERLVPPYLVDLSTTRIAARALTGERAIAETRQAEARALVVQHDHLGQFPRYLAWADREYVEVKSYVRRRPDEFRRVYVAPDVDLAAVRSALATAIQTPLRAQLGPAVLHGYSLDRPDVAAGSRLGLTLHWESLVDNPPEHHLIVRLRGGDGATVHESEWRIGDGSQQLESWPAGRWMFQAVSLLVREGVRAGPYRLTVSLVRPNGNPAPVVVSPTEAARVSGTELELATVRVR